MNLYKYNRNLNEFEVKTYKHLYFYGFDINEINPDYKFDYLNSGVYNKNTFHHRSNDIDRLLKKVKEINGTVQVFIKFDNYYFNQVNPELEERTRYFRKLKELLDCDEAKVNVIIPTSAIFWEKFINGGMFTLPEQNI